MKIEYLQSNELHVKTILITVEYDSNLQNKLTAGMYIYSYNIFIYSIKHILCKFGDLLFIIFDFPI